ncbi:MAG: hypothetical protein AAF791_02255 [Bacteroidota bacterium]
MAKSRKSSPARKRNQPAPLEGNEVWKKRGRVRRSGPSVSALTEKTWWERQAPAVRHAICLGFLLVVALGFTAPATFTGDRLAGDDTLRWRAMAADILEWQERTGGETPLWAPNLFAGMPAYFIHDPSGPPSVDSVPSSLRGFGLWPVAHLIVMLFGAYALVFFLTRTPLAAVAGAITYSLTTYFPIILVAGHNSKFIALAYAPWLLLAFAALLRRPSGSGWMLSALLTGLFAIAAAVNIEAGHIQITYYVVILAGIWWVVEGIADWRDGTIKAFGVSTLFLLVGSVLALAMMAHPTLAQWEYKEFTIRSAGPGGGLAWEYAMNWSQGLGELTTLLVAGAYGGASPTYYWGAKIFTSGPHYVGAVVIFLALLGVAGVARRSVVAFAVVGVLTLLFALGENFELLNRTAFEVLPLFNSFRVPETWLAITSLLLALLAGWGAYYLQRREATPEAAARKQRNALLIGGGLGAVLLVIAVAGPSLFALERDGETAQIEAQIQQSAVQQGMDPRDPAVAQQISQIVGQARTELRTERTEMLTGDAWRSLLFLGLALGLVVARLRGRIPSWAALSGLALLITIDLWGVGRRYFNEDASALRSRTDLTANIPKTDADRFIEEREIEAGGPGTFRVLPSSPSQNEFAMAHYESVGGYHGAKLALIQDYFDRILPDDSTVFNENAVDLLGARYTLLPGLLPGTTPLFQDPASGMVVGENPDALPRAFLVQDAVVVDDETAIARIRSDETDLRQVALLAEDLPAGVSLPGRRVAVADSVGTDAAGVAADSVRLGTEAEDAVGRALAPGVTLVRFAPEEVVWTVETDAPSLLIVNEIYYPAGWTATVDSREAPILRANILHRAVPVPAGRSIVEMRFEPEAHARGLFISWISTLLVYLGVVALAGLLWYRRGQDDA